MRHRWCAHTNRRTPDIIHVWTYGRMDVIGSCRPTWVVVVVVGFIRMCCIDCMYRCMCTCVIIIVIIFFILLLWIRMTICPSLRLYACPDLIFMHARRLWMFVYLLSGRASIFGPVYIPLLSQPALCLKESLPPLFLRWRHMSAPFPGRV